MSALNGGGFLRGFEDGALAGGIVGGFIGAYRAGDLGPLQAPLKGLVTEIRGYITNTLAEVGNLQALKFTMDPKTGQFGQGEAVPLSSIRGVVALFVNGMLNDLEQATNNGGRFEAKQNVSSFYLLFSDTHGFWGDLLAASEEKVFGFSSEGAQLAQVLEQIDPDGSSLTLHSRGALVGQNALNAVIADGASLNGLTINGYGPAASYYTMDAFASMVGAKIDVWEVNPFDLVPNTVGGNEIFRPWNAVLSLLAAPWLFEGGPTRSPHSSISYTGRSFWSWANANIAK